MNDLNARARRIIERIRANDETHDLELGAVEFLAAELRSVGEEGQKSAYETMIKDCHRHVAEAYADAARQCDSEGCPECANSIRAMAAQ